MQYKVIRKCHGFRGRMWEEGQIVEVDPKENPPKHFVPLEEVVKEAVEEKKVVIRTDPLEMEPGKNRQAQGGFAESIKKDKIDRIMTVDKVPNNAPEPKITRKRTRKKKVAGSAQK